MGFLVGLGELGKLSMGFLVGLGVVGAPPPLGCFVGEGVGDKQVSSEAGSNLS